MSHCNPRHPDPTLVLSENCLGNFQKPCPSGRTADYLNQNHLHFSYLQPSLQRMGQNHCCSVSPSVSRHHSPLLILAAAVAVGAAVTVALFLSRPRGNL